MKPIILINFKTYTETTGEKALALAKLCEKVAKDTGENIMVAVSAADIYRVASQVKIPVWAQHIDMDSPGKSTGRITAEAVKAAGAAGTLLNHSERRLRLDVIENSLRNAKKVGLKTCICANDPTTGQAVAAFDPDYVAVEPPELIGGDISVSTAKPEVITESVNKICKTDADNMVLVGAGVKTGADIKKALELGAKGVLLASGVTSAKDPEKVLKELCNYK